MNPRPFTTDPAEDPAFINAKVREGLEKELRRTDLSAEDRAQYEQALANLEKTQSTPDGA